MPSCQENPRIFESSLAILKDTWEEKRVVLSFKLMFKLLLKFTWQPDFTDVSLVTFLEGEREGRFLNVSQGGFWCKRRTRERPFSEATARPRPLPRVPIESWGDEEAEVSTILDISQHIVLLSYFDCCCCFYWLFRSSAEGGSLPDYNLRLFGG